MKTNVTPWPVASSRGTCALAASHFSPAKAAVAVALTSDIVRCPGNVSPLITAELSPG